jgi:hypothetical protein
MFTLFDSVAPNCLLQTTFVVLCDAYLSKTMLSHKKSG